MAGGVFSSQNKARPGAYINTIPQVNDIPDNVTGIVLLVSPVGLKWGKHGVISLDKSSDFNSLLGTDLSDPNLLPVKEAFKNANQVKLINNNVGNHASLNIQNTPLTATAKYAGAKGNNIIVNVIRNLADNSKVNIQTIFNGRMVDNQLVTTAGQVIDNSLIHFDMDGNSFNDLNNTAGGNLSGGTTESADFYNLLGESVQTTDFDVISTAGFDEKDIIHSLVAQMVEDLRSQEGYKVTAVVPKGTTNMDSEAITQIANGVVLNNGTTIDKSVASAYVAGLSATTTLNQSLTYHSYTGATEAYPAFNNDNTINSLNAGEMVFSQLRNGSVVIEQDINSLHSFGEKPQSFSKNRIIRTLDFFENDTKESFEMSFIGKVSNDGTGRSLFAANRLAALRELEKNNVIENVTNNDVSVEKGNNSDSIVVNIAIKPVDSIEKLYMTVFVQ